MSKKKIEKTKGHYYIEADLDMRLRILAAKTRLGISGVITEALSLYLETNEAEASTKAG